MLLTDSNGPEYSGPINKEIPSPTPLKIVVDDISEAGNSSELQSPTPLPKATSEDICDGSMIIILLLVVLSIFGMGLYQVLKSDKK